MSKRKQLMYIVLPLAGLVALATLIVAIWLLATVDDWSRDFTTNHATTSANAKQASLHPIRSERPAAELAELVAAAAKQLAGWELVAREHGADETTLLLVRTTRLMRFKDDITVHIRRLSDSLAPGSEITAQSQSRVGLGDFGQNPRNLAELMDKIRCLLR